MAKNVHSPSSSQLSKNYSISDSSDSVVSPFSQEKKDFSKRINFIVDDRIDIIHVMIKFIHDGNGVIISVAKVLGYISEVTLLNPFSPGKEVTMHGNFRIVALSGFYINNLLPPNLKDNDNIHSSFTVQFTNGDSLQIHGGLVGRKLIAVGSVKITAYVSEKHEYHRTLDRGESLEELRKVVEANNTK